MEEETRTLTDFVEIFRRRKWSFLLPFVSCVILALTIGLVLPPIYRSVGTILIEEQEIPREYVMSTVSSFAEQRVQSISQRIMSSTRLLEIIEQFNLYADLRDRMTIEEIVEQMRRDIKFDMISAEVIDRRTGRPTTAFIAFNVSYQGKNPALVQKVASVLASLYLEENMKVREQYTTGAVRFIEDEMKDVQAKLADLDARIAAYKQKHLFALPEMNPLNFQELERIDRSLEQLEIQLRSLKERESSLEVQLSSIPSTQINADQERLKELRVKLVYLKSRYADHYPDIPMVEREIEKLERKLERSNGTSADDRSGHPGYVSLAAQLAGTQIEIESLKRQIQALQEKREEYLKRIQRSPRVEEAYRLLTIERNNLQTKYDDLMRKHLETKVASELERQQMGERFTLIDPPRVPEKPISPKFWAILLIGVVLGVGSGVAMVSLKEHLDPSVRSVPMVRRMTGLPVLVTLPEIRTPREIARSRKRRFALLASLLLITVMGILVFHFFVMDLDIFWEKLERRLPL